MYINDYNNTIDIEDVVNECLKGINTHDRKVFNQYRKIEIVVPCFCHRNEPNYFDKGLGLDIYKHIKDLEFPYHTTYKFPHHRPVEVIVYDNFWSIDINLSAEAKRKELDKYTRIQLHSSGEKYFFMGYVKGIGNEK